jgi:alkylation response protein AidB-like acyl-CoA dehydrogenase
VPLLRRNALETERERRVAAENIAALAEAGIFRITLPRRFGGYECSVATQVDVLAEVARGCGSTSWVAAVYSVGTWIAALLADEAQEEIFATPDVRISVVGGSPTALARRVDGGFRFTGRWPFSTGCLDAHWASLGAAVDGESVQELRQVIGLVPYTELEIHDDWFVTGLTGTGSCTVSGEDVFVPDERILVMSEVNEGRIPSKLNASLPLYRAPFTPLIIANSAGTPLGLGRAALEAFRDRLPGRGITFTSYTDQSEAPVTHLRLAEASMLVDSAAFHARRCAETVDAKAVADDSYTLEERARVRMDLAWTTHLARSAARILREASGATSIHEQVPIQRIWRDVEALALHGLLNLQTNLELYGRILCGLEADTPFI